MKRKNALMTDEEYALFTEEEADFWNDYYQKEKAKAMPDIEVIHCGYRVIQTYAFYEDEKGKMYGRYWSHADTGKFIMHSLGEYLSEDELKKQCEDMDAFLLALERIE